MKNIEDIQQGRRGRRRRGRGRISHLLMTEASVSMRNSKAM
jgi:hypothetical protein